MNGTPPSDDPEPPAPSWRETGRRSAWADASLAAELERLERLGVEGRIRAALSMGERFTWLDPAPAPAEEEP
jgi:hypothetical protein